MTFKNQNDLAKGNAEALSREFIWLEKVLKACFQEYFYHNEDGIESVEIPDLSDIESPYTDFIREHNLDWTERLVLLIALAPYVIPKMLDVFFTKNSDYGRAFSEFGGIQSVQHKGFLPTGETICFVLAGADFERRFEIERILSDEHIFFSQGILRLESERTADPLMSGQVVLNQEYVHRFTQGSPYHPKFSSNFPAKRLLTSMNWDDLVLPNTTLEEVKDILTWLRYNETLMADWGMRGKLKRGYRTLFYGPPGTGKTLTASLMGKEMNMDVYRVDLSQVVSKYIGETEKNMGGLFDQAENKNWILFFDEADSLFSKRTKTSDSKDRNANQEVSYLLQRIEDYPGVVILASNLKGNIDEAFARRFQSMTFFPMPNVEERYTLWKNAFPKKMEFDDDVDLFDIAAEYEMAGGAITNVVRYASLQTLSRASNSIQANDIILGIKKELKKEGKTITTK